MSPNTSNSNQPTLSILCFGDSLTEGYSQYGTKFTPYSTSLSKHLANTPIGASHAIKITTDGVSGQLVTAGFQKRMERSLQAGHFDWVVFLGGTNDLGWGRNVDDIWKSIKEITGMALKAGSKILFLTIPECAVKNERLDGKRGELNGLIKGDGREWVFALDLWKAIPYHDMEEEERDRIWDDGLHFTDEGYERIGKLVAERLVEIMGGEAKVENPEEKKEVES